MSATRTFEDFLTNQAPQIDLPDFMLNLGLTGLLAIALSLVYNRWGRSAASRKATSANFVLIAMTTMLIISVVKSSLALSLGLVGALSIIRFRTAIKEPEELAFLFIAISIGLGFGADQRKTTIVGFLAITAIFLILRMRIQKSDSYPMYLYLEGAKGLAIPDIESIIKSHTLRSSLKKASENQFVFVSEFKSTKEVEDLRQALRKTSSNLYLTITEYTEIG